MNLDQIIEGFDNFLEIHGPNLNRNAFSDISLYVKNLKELRDELKSNQRVIGSVKTDAYDDIP